jgi:hypothetical protein
MVAKSFNLIIVGFILLVIGAVLPLLMVTGVLESTYFANGVAIVGQVAGLFIGLIGIGMYTASRK